MSCTRVPPAATFSTWTPRQIAKIGKSRSRAAATSAISNSSRAGSTSSSPSRGDSPYLAGSTSPPPVSSRPSTPARASATGIDGSTRRTSPPARKFERAHDLFDNFVEPRGLEHKRPQVARHVGQLVGRGGIQVGENIRVGQAFALAKLVEDIVRADDSILKVRPRFAFEAERFLD